VNVSSASSFFSKARYQDNPLAALTSFLDHEERLEQAGDTARIRFVGYVLELGYDAATVITSDPYKRAVGGIPRGSFLIMAPGRIDGMPPHFTLLRVNSVAATPLSIQVQQTYFELHKKSMPDLDRFTQGELQWGALSCSVLGMFYPQNEDATKLAFSGDVNNVVSAHRYKVFAPNEELLRLIVNGVVRDNSKFEIGDLRMTECMLALPEANMPSIPVEISVLDFIGARTAMFGKTRLGKSNTVKLVAQAVIETTESTKNIGQLIFDVNGEYANDNSQNLSIPSAYPHRSVVYALVQRSATASKPLKLNFYEQPDTCLPIIAGLLEQSNMGNSQYIKAFASVELPSIASIQASAVNQQKRQVRRIQIFWAILSRAGFTPDEQRLSRLGLRAQGRSSPATFDPAFSSGLRDAAWAATANPPATTPSAPSSLQELVRELEAIADYMRANETSTLLQSSSGNDLFEADDKALLNFLRPKSGGGPAAIQSFRAYHDPQASDVAKEIIQQLDAGMTVILDLGSATDKIRRYFSDMLSREVFARQEVKFTENSLGDHFIQLYFEEAHNLFPKDAKALTDVYSRFAKEGAKFHIGMVYSTQSPSTISQELLAQTENFFVGHLSSQDEARSLARVQVQYDGLQEEIMRSKTPGYMRMITQSHRFVIPVQIRRFESVVQGKI
jgi:hypothetical protein